jgi:hypothetical protein
MSTPRPFVVFSLPRSRSAWLSHYLSYDLARPIGHDILIECDTPDDFFNSFRLGMIGTVETGGIEAAELIQKAMSQVKFLVILRPLSEVKASLAKFGIVAPSGQLEQRQKLLFSLAYQGIPTVEFRDLANPSIARFIFEYCLERPYDPIWRDACEMTNIQIDMAKRVSRLQFRAAAIAKLKALAHVQV